MTRGPFSITTVGCGNIGSYTIPLLAQEPDIGQITIVDSDVYAPENGRSQAIERADIGRPKATALAARLRRKWPNLAVQSWYASVQDVPPGALNADVLCGCVDSRSARMYLNEIAFRFGMAYVDAGVHGPDRIARVDYYRPSIDSPCMECAFGASHYDTLETRTPCRPGSFTAPSNSPAHLGAFAASLQASICIDVLRSRPESIASGTQIVAELRTYSTLINRNLRNVNCRFDHGIYTPTTLDDGRPTLRSILRDYCRGTAMDDTALTVYRRAIYTGTNCRACGVGHFFIVDRGLDLTLRCFACGARSVGHPFDLHETVRLGDVPESLLGRPIRTIGLRRGDMFRIGTIESAKWFVVGCGRYQNRRTIDA